MLITQQLKRKIMYSLFNSKTYLKTAITTIIFGCISLGILAAPKLPGMMHEMPPVIVNTAIVKKEIWQNKLLFTGSIAATSSVTLTTDIAGYITKIHFKSNDLVKKDDVLVELNNDMIRAQLDKAKTQLKFSESNYTRLLELYNKKFYNKADLEKAEAEWESAKADMNQLNTQLSHTFVRAPFDGKLGLSRVSVGEYIAPGSPIVNLQSMQDLYVEFNVSEKELEELNIGDPIDFKTPASPKTIYKGHISAVDSKIDELSRTLSVRAKIDLIDERSIPGLSVTGTLYLAEPQSVLTIPQTALVYEPEGIFAYRMIDHKAIKTKLVLGKTINESSIIVSQGLAENDIVILGAQVKLQDGANVMVENS
jgi:membrane fusion protein, multidrug efflux system